VSVIETTGRATGSLSFTQQKLSEYLCESFSGINAWWTSCSRRFRRWVLWRIIGILVVLSLSRPNVVVGSG